MFIQKGLTRQISDVCLLGMWIYSKIYTLRLISINKRSLIIMNIGLFQNLFDMAYRSKQAMSDHYEWGFVTEIYS